MNPNGLSVLLTELLGSIDKMRCVVISRLPRSTVMTARDPGNERLIWLDDVKTVSDLDGLDRCSVAVVFEQLEHVEKQNAMHLLARLRDRHAERVIVADDCRVFTTAQLLALGFVKDDRPQVSERLYVYDPDVYFRPREWNNSSDWAIPENFDKFRW